MNSLITITEITVAVMKAFGGVFILIIPTTTEIDVFILTTAQVTGGMIVMAISMRIEKILTKTCICETSPINGLL